VSVSAVLSTFSCRTCWMMLSRAVWYGYTYGYRCTQVVRGCHRWRAGTWYGRRAPRLGWKQARLEWPSSKVPI
jgi:hypothetical protein